MGKILVGTASWLDPVLSSAGIRRKCRPAIGSVGMRSISIWSKVELDVLLRAAATNG